jgi:hypothetical protein
MFDSLDYILKNKMQKKLDPNIAQGKKYKENKA